jgi:hypothetical protein
VHARLWDFFSSSFRKQPPLDPANEFSKRKPLRAAHRAFPYGHNSPTHFVERTLRVTISGTIPGDFLDPELAVRFGNYKEPAPMTMPETAVNKQRRLVLGKDEIGRSW